MKKIIFLRANPSALGGAERYLSRLTNALNSLQIECKIRSFSGSQKLSSWLKALKFNRQVCAQKGADELYFSLERIECADIYRAGDGVHKIYRALKPFWWLNPLNFVYPHLEKKCFANAKLIIANSNFIKNQIIDAYGTSADKICVIYNGINLPAKIEKGSAKLAICDKFGLDFKLPIVLFVGSGFKRKGVAEYLQILHLARSKFGAPSFNAIVVGADKHLENYRNLARKLGVNALFTGAQKDVSKFYECADVFLFPTHYEPFSNAVLEAMSYKNAVITTTQNGAAEILDADFVLDSTDEASKILTKLLSEAKFCEKIGENNYKIAQNFTIEKNAKLSVEAISRVIKEKNA